MLGLDNPIHIAFVLVLVLLVFGAKRLPEMGRSLGAGLRGFKESISGEDHVTQITTHHEPVRVDDLTARRTPVSGPSPEPTPEASPHNPAQPVA
ncbi:MAG: twin-arginine translocase TatA/TatE family subunit [Solirubrobacterales bacterium]|nr:twin-arginine translocase TatA/TatE family subunit [Solirubrobacterales bacterium]